MQNGTCPQDCPLPYTLCPATEAGLCSATGRCSFSSGLCSCYAGCVIMTSHCGDSPYVGRWVPSHARARKAVECSEPLLCMAPKDMGLLCRYAGRACEACAAGFQPVGGRCVPIFQLLMPPPVPAPKPSAAAPVRSCLPLGIPGTGLQSWHGGL